MADSTTPRKTHDTVKRNGREKMGKTKFLQNFAVVFCKFLNASNNNNEMVQHIHKTAQICHTDGN